MGHFSVKIPGHFSAEINSDAIKRDLEASSDENLTRLDARVAAYADAIAHRLPDISTNLWLLLAATLQRFGERPDDRISLEGPDVTIPPEHAGTLGLTFHELLDNAFQHGALRAATGRVDVRWTVAQEGDEPWLHLTWHERGVSRPLTTWPQTGFGFELLTVGLKAVIGARTEFDLRQEGLHLVLDMPMKHVD